MLAVEQTKELSRKYLDGEITEVEFWNECIRIAYVHQDPEFTKWFTEQLLIAR